MMTWPFGTTTTHADRLWRLTVVARARRRLALAPSHRLRVPAVTMDRPRQAGQDERRLVLERDDPGGRGVVLPEAGPELGLVGPDLGILRRGTGRNHGGSTSMS